VIAPDALKNIRIVLCRPAHPGNIGAAARAMKTMGLSDLALIDPRRFPDPEAVTRASRATDILDHAVVCASLSGALEGAALSVAMSARPRDVAVSSVTMRDAALEAARVAATQRVALVFGNETYGLTTDEVNLCSVRAFIPANPDYSSLNLAAAVQIAAYEVRMALELAPEAEAGPSLATHEELERLYAHLDEVMVETGFLNPDHPKKLAARVRRLFARTRLEHEEVNILRGLLKTLTDPKRNPGRR
jgi:tRNA/rRNA methyltransferase